MAEGEEAAGGLGEALTRKLGPLPAWMYLVLAAGAWYYLQRRKTAASTAAAAATGTAAAGGTVGTDPAGNTGQIDPQTGYVYGTPEDTAALQQQSGSASSSGKYSDNNAWGQAAINYLVGLGEDATAANSAISAYLGSQTLTTAQQAMVNSAIQALGAPPQPPAPTSTTPVVAPPGGATTYATNPPTGLAVTSTTATSIGLKWNAATNATGYTVTAAADGSPAQTVTVTSPLATVSGLTPLKTYSISVQATPADTGAGKATTTAKTSYGATGTGGAAPTPGGTVVLKPGEVISVGVNIVPPATVTSTARKFGIAPQHLLDFNPGTTLSSTGVVQIPVLVKQGDTVQSIAQRFGISPEHLETELQQQGIT